MCSPCQYIGQNWSIPWIHCEFGLRSIGLFGSKRRIIDDIIGINKHNHPSRWFYLRTRWFIHFINHFDKRYDYFVQCLTKGHLLVYDLIIRHWRMRLYWRILPVSRRMVAIMKVSCVWRIN